MISPGPNRIGSTIRLQASFLDDDGELSDPVALVAKVRKPESGAIVTYKRGTDGELVRDSVGAYSLYVTPDSAGRWLVRWDAEVAAGNLILEDNFIVQTSPFIDRCGTRDYT